MPFYTRDFSKPEKQTLDALPFAELAEMCQGTMPGNKELDTAVETWIEQYNIRNKHWVYPQCQARVAKWRAVRGDDNLFSVKLMLQSIGTSTLDRGIYYFLVSNRRALIKQSSVEGLAYCSAVPLILASHKKFNGIKYSDWNREDCKLIIHSDLYEAATLNRYPYSLDDIMAWRELGLTVKSGKQQGITKSAKTTYGLNGLPWQVGETIKGPAQMPQLARMMMCQTWCWHPENRHEYMIADPDNWDQLPEALVTSGVFGEQSDSAAKPAEPVNLIKLPWD